MGYGEFGGDGSVEWRVVHGDDKKQKGKEQRHTAPKKGRDVQGLHQRRRRAGRRDRSMAERRVGGSRYEGDV